MDEQAAEAGRPMVGLGLLVVRDDVILLGKRKGSHGEGEWAGPGGHLEAGETFEEVEREFREEVGDEMVIKDIGFLCVTNILRYMPKKHYVDIGMVATWVSGEPIVMEPDKVVCWEWHPMDNPPTPLMAGMENYIEAYQSGQVYFSTAK